MEGAVYSSARSGSNFNVNTRLKILFLGHEREQCSKSPPSKTKLVFEQQQKTNPLKTEFILIKGGEAQPQNPCGSGFHMYFGASEEAYKAIEQFVLGPLQ